MQRTLPLGLAPVLPPIRNRLLAVYGPQRDVHRHDPTTQCVKAMISSCTRDQLSEAAFQRLQIYCPSWEVLPDINPAAIVPIIPEVTDPSVKAFRLVMAARTVRDKSGVFNLDFLGGWPVEDAMSWLQLIRGIKAKTAAAILNFSSLRKRVLVVDRHVLRVSKRLGLVPDTAGFQRGFRILMRIVPDNWDADDLYELHWLVKRHGQERCRHERADCRGCPLADVCVHGAAVAQRRGRPGGAIAAAQRSL